MVQNQTMTSASLESFADLSTDELLVLGLLWKHYTEIDPSPAWGTARESILELLTPEDGADIRAAHAARAEVEKLNVPIECYAAIQWTYFAERYKDQISAASYKAVTRAWRAAFPKNPHDPEVVAEIIANTPINAEGYFDFAEPITGTVVGQPAQEPDWDQEREIARFREVVAPLLP